MSGLTDATPSWSGYIFQGEVALCRALEKLNSFDDPFNIPQSYLLRLERDEDFSLRTENIEVFQVKAYVGFKTDRFSKYKRVVEDLLDKYYYYTIWKPDPADGRKLQVEKPGKKRNKPISCFLITHSNIVDFQEGWNRLDEKYREASRDNFRTLSGTYMKYPHLLGQLSC